MVVTDYLELDLSQAGSYFLCITDDSPIFCSLTAPFSFRKGSRDDLSVMNMAGMATHGICGTVSTTAAARDHSMTAEVTAKSVNLGTLCISSSSSATSTSIAKEKVNYPILCLILSAPI